ncbi:two-component regulator propeller domain-containing protein [Pontibacter pamirensis]|uniref:two-component regulator propeller domain-containing protein n=1 Tax=Pontibacter pamirensis TaxID=2562824 RepID=UPI001389C209|nr:two-component regulator propeller domain-containing protein [Pontibacter pamirensis]
MKYVFLFNRTFLFLLLLLLTSLPGQSQHTVFTKVNPPEGVRLQILGIAQDNQGYMWIATQDGLHRYDGYRYTSYYHDPNDKNSLSNNVTETVFVSKDGAIWIGTFGGGMDLFDPHANTFTHFVHDPKDSTSLSDNLVTAILEDREGVMWVGTHGGLHRFHPENGTFTRYQHNPQDSTSLSHDQVRALYQDREGTLWVGTGSPWNSKPGEGGLNRFHPKTGTFTRYLHHPNDPGTLIDNKVRAIYEDSRGTFWVGTLGDGLHTMDREKGTFTRHQYNPDQPEKLSRTPIIGKNQDGVSFIHEDVTGAIWIGTQGGGISRYDPGTEKVVHYVRGTRSSCGLQDNDVWQAYNSKEGVLWVGTWAGLYRTDPMQLSFVYQPTGAKVSGLFEDADRKIWVCTSKGLKLYDMSSGDNRQLTPYPSLPPGLEKEAVYTIMKDRQGTMWIGGEKGLWRRDLKQGTFKLYDHDPKVATSIGEGAVVALHEDREGLLWIGTLKGSLHLMKTKTEAFTHFQYDPNKYNSHNSNFVTAIYEDHKGNVWVGTWHGKGVSVLERKSGKFKQYPVPTTQITSIQEDDSGRLWVGSNQTGLYYYDQRNDNFVRYKANSTDKYISSVRGIVQDDQENLWISAGVGLIKLDRKKNIVSTYGTETGLDPGAFHILAVHKGRKGNIYIGDTLGFYTYAPANYNQNPPHIDLTDFRLFNESTRPGKEGLLPVPVGQAKEITLTHLQNVFSFHFAGIHFTNPGQNRQYYMLENYDTGWRKVDTEQTAFYYKVPPGKYVFRMKAASSEGVWAEKNIPVIIHPPWWHTWWAYGLFAAVFAASLWSYVAYRSRSLRKENKLLEQKVADRTTELQQSLQHLKSTQAQLIQSEKMASLGELTAGVAHEIQNPLNFVNNFSEVSSELVQELKQEIYEDRQEVAIAIAADLEQNLLKIHHHGQRADAIVKGMLQHSRASSGEKQRTNLSSLAEEYLRLAYSGFRSKNKGFTCTIETSFDENLEKVEVMPQELGRVLLNLFNNAFYAVQQKQRLEQPNYGPKVRVSTHKQEGQVEIRVQDNGTGVQESVMNKIFQPFFTTKPAGQGTGLGLSLSYDIITKSHGGELKVASNEGEWSEFTISLPYMPVPEELLAATIAPLPTADTFQQP